MKFNHLNVPNTYKQYWTRYPEGYTILEALLTWVKQVDDMVDNVNNWNEYLDGFVSTFDKELQTTVTNILSEWQQSGFLDVVINEALDTKYHEMDERLTSQIAAANNQVANLSLNKMDKATKNISVEQLNKNLGKLDETYMTEAFLQQIAGNAPINSVPADSSITTSKLAPRSVTESKLSFLYNKLSLVSGYLHIDTISKQVSFTKSSILTSNMGRNYAVDAQSVSYTGSNERVQFVFLNTDNLRLETHEANSVPNTGNLAYICSFYSNNVYATNNPQLITINNKQATNEMANYQQSTVLSGTISVTTQEVNGELQHTLSANNVLISLTKVYRALENIELLIENPSNRIQYVYFNDVNKKIEVYENDLTPNNPALYLIFSFHNGKIYNCNSFSGVVVDGRTLSSQTIPTTDFSDLSINAIGDSITAADNLIPYTETISNILGTTKVENYGVTGTSIAVRSGRTDSILERYSQMANSEVIYAMGGTNDFWTSVPIGNFETRDNTTFYGALRELCEGLLSSYPSAFIFFGTPPKSWREVGYPNEGTNENGDTMEDFNQAIKKVCGYYSIPLLDLKHDLGIDPSIPQHFTMYSRDGVHYNNRGYQVIGKTIANFIKNKYNR